MLLKLEKNEKIKILSDNFLQSLKILKNRAPKEIEALITNCYKKNPLCAMKFLRFIVEAGAKEC